MLTPRLSRGASTRPAARVRPQVEQLESREVPFVTSGNSWVHPELITISFVPDGTVVSSGGATSNLMSSFNTKFGSAAVWQKEILRAAQTWARYTNINFAVITDSGATIGSGSYQQGDPTFGDIRIGGYNFGTATTLGMAHSPPQVNNYSIAGDIQLNTGANFNLTTTYHLYTVALHEIGHALGLSHSTLTAAAMYKDYMGTKFDANADDQAGIRAIYSGGAARTDDAYDLGALDNGGFGNATDLTSSFTGLTLLANNLDLTTNSDKDYFKFITPAGSGSTLKVKVQTAGLSLLSPKITVYAPNASTVLGTATAYGDYDGGTLTVTVNGVSPLTQYYVKVEGAETLTNPTSWQSFNTGKYALTLNLGTGSDPVVPLPNTQTDNGNPIQAGGGQATVVRDEFRVNTSTTNYQSNVKTAVAPDGRFVVVWQSDHSGNQDVYAQRYDVTGTPLGGEFRVNTYTTNSQSLPDIAMDDNGNFVIVWESYGQDGSGAGIYGQRYNASGVVQGGEFRVNTATLNDQGTPSVAMDDAGNFVVAWESYAQDGSGEGVYAQRYNATAVKQGSEFRVNTYTSGDQYQPDVAMDDAGKFVVVWTSSGQDGSGDGVYAKRYNASGVVQGSEFRVNSHTADSQGYADVAMDGDGDFVVVWDSYGQDGNGYGVYGQRYTSGGVALGGEFRVNTATVDSQLDAAIAMDSAGNFLVTWSSFGQDGDQAGLFAQQYSAGGQTMGAEFFINQTTAGAQEFSALAMNDAGNAVVVWQGNGPGDSTGVFAQLYAVNTASGMHNLTSIEPHAYGLPGTHDHDHGHGHGHGKKNHGNKDRGHDEDKIDHHLAPKNGGNNSRKRRGDNDRHR